KLTLTACRVMMRDGSASAVVLRIASSTVCRTQIRKMQSASPASVLAVRIQFRFRCLRMYGRYFILPPDYRAPAPTTASRQDHPRGQDAFFEVALEAGPRSRAWIVRDHHDRFLEFAIERFHQIEDVLGALCVEIARRLICDEHIRIGH